MAGKKQPAAPKPASRGGAASRSSTSSPRGAAPSRASKPKPSRATDEEDVESEEEIRRQQQTVLDVFGSTFRDVLGAADFDAQLQAVKAALFNRDFGAAFAREAALDVYAARWSPTRALCYGRVLRRLDARLRSLASDDQVPRRKDLGSGGDGNARRGEGGGGHDEHARDEEEEERSREHGVRDAEPGDQEAHEASAAMAADQTANKGEKGEEEEGEGGEGGGRGKGGGTRTLRVLSIGGAAAEIVAFADYISAQDASATPHTIGEITLLDVGPWGTIVQRLQTALTTPPPISPYASAAARSATSRAPLVPPGSLRSAFLQRDVLSLDRDELVALLSVENNNDDEQPRPEPVLITLLFTLNELYTTSGTRRTTSFLRLLSALVAPGSLLLVVDSPGSYAEAAVGKDGRRYPMQWLLDHTLVPPPEKGRGDGREEEDERRGAGGVRWEKLESHDSVWFRVADGLRYPIPLENMRYQMHLYRAHAG
ncbi:hypothetical protein F5Y14DRAFT_422420 [Nemania sp. NC0429]|nr:hypothetical protein F5Y14DRAFT_422420 [Nemania sp. NC0429]